MQSFNTFLAASVHPNIGRLLFSRPPLEGDARQAAQDVAMGKLRLIEDKLFAAPGPWGSGLRSPTAICASLSAGRPRPA
jgi:glutathione S-transferase